MEPFGLLQFLQSLLNPPVSSPQDTDKTPPETPRESVPPPTVSTENKGNDTYLKFITAHESRIQKTRK